MTSRPREQANNNGRQQNLGVGNDHTPQDQQAVIDFLSRCDAYRDRCSSVERIDTHISHIFLTGDFAYKLKRSLVLPYLDFSTSDKRRAVCQTELRLNQRTAPTLYLAVIPITREADGSLKLDGIGRPVDWLVKMRRFDNATLFSKMAERGDLTESISEQLAHAIAEFHEISEPLHGDFEPQRTRAVLDVNLAGFLAHGGSVVTASQARTLTERSVSALDQCAPLLVARETAGKLRHCHGDLHLANICLIDDKPTLFDALEFNAAMAEIDVLYDLAFLLMDFDHWGLRTLANVTFNRYIDMTNDLQGLELLPLFLSMRAAVRSHVSLAQHETITDAVRDLSADAKAFYEMACAYLLPSTPRLLAVGGFSGTGKSCVARAIAPELGAAPGARIVRTDAVRKRLAGSDLYAPLPQSGYGTELSQRTYEVMYEEARCALKAGQSVICDGVFARPQDRQQVRALAEDLNVPFSGIWLTAPERTLIERVTARVNDISDASPQIVRRQLSVSPGTMDWHEVDASANLATTVTRARRCLV